MVTAVVEEDQVHPPVILLALTWQTPPLALPPLLAHINNLIQVTMFRILTPLLNPLILSPPLLLINEETRLNLYAPLVVIA